MLLALLNAKTAEDQVRFKIACFYLSVSDFSPAAVFGSLIASNHVGDLSVLSTAGATPLHRLQWDLSLSSPCF